MEPEICLFEKYIIVYSCEYHILILSFFFFIKKSSFVIIEKDQNKNKTKNKDLKTSILTNVKTNETDNDIFDAYGSGDKRHDGTEDADMKKGGEEQTRPTSAAIFGEDKILLLFDDNKSDIDGEEEKDKRDGRGENEKDTDKIGHGNEKDANITPVHFDFVAFKSVEMLCIADAANCMKKGEGYYNTGPNSVEVEEKEDSSHRHLTILAGMTREKEGAIDGTLPSHNGSMTGSNPCSSNGSIWNARKMHETKTLGLSQPTPTAVVFGFLTKALTSLFVFFQGNSLNKLFPSMILLLFPLVSVAASNTTTTTISMHKSSLCDINDAVPFKQMDATLGECKYQCISLHTCSGMQYVDPKQCILYDVPFSSVSV